MTEECKDQEREAEHAGDRYYQAMTAWLTNRRRSDEDRQKAFVLARVYYRSLDLVQKCLDLVHRPEARRKSEYAAELQAHLKTEIDILGSTGSALSSQADEA